MQPNHHVCGPLCNERIGFHVRPEVVWWAKETELTLQRNDHKGGWLGEEFPTREALKRLRKEIVELEYALKDGSPSDIIGEAADVSNFAMMIADRARRGLQ